LENSSYIHMPKFHIRLARDDLVFSAGHFITLQDGVCERLHGHSYGVAAEVYGPLDENQCVVDFRAAHDALRRIIGELDHRMLLPTGHPAIQVHRLAAEVEVRFADRRWLFPPDDCLLLPVANTTTELLAEYVGRRLFEALKGQCGVSPGRVRIEIGEGTGCSACWES
jgi:6-pyruvoyltetrahydropterin/6-carboxytetrahydropterin synthase